MLKLFLFNLFIAFTAVLSQNSCPNPLNVGTFNTLQIFFAPFKDTRLDETIDYLRDDLTDLSVLCLQELWDSNQRNRVISQLSSQYPYSFYAPSLPQNECSGGCRSSEVNSIKDCLSSFKCLDFTDGVSFSDCISTNCAATLEGLGAECTTCLQQGTSFSDVFRNIDNCLSNDEPTNATSPCYAFGAQSDNLILSKIPFETTDVLYFKNSPITLTTALYAKLQTSPKSTETTHIFCTHLLPAELPVLTFEEEVNMNQTKELLGWIDSKLTVDAASETVIVLGDFNHGPSGYFPANYDHIVTSGYHSAFIENGHRNCTYCNSNPLTFGSTNNMIIDHIYLRNSQSTSSNRFGTYWDESVEIDHEILGIAVGTNEVTLSDHYGVRASVCPVTAGQTITGTLSSAIKVVDNDNFPGSSSGALSICISFFTFAFISLFL